MATIFDDFYRGRGVLVTGHTGFKGSWLALWLRKLGAHVSGLSLGPPTEPNLFTALGIVDDLMWYNRDIRNLSGVEDVVERERPEIIIHLAAQSLVGLSYSDPLETYSTNVMGTVNLLEAVRRNDCVRSVVVVTSDKCYENEEWPWGYRETDNLGGHDPYSTSKAAAELVSKGYRESFFNRDSRKSGRAIGLATARAGNVIGGGDWGTDRLIPDLFRAMDSGARMEVRNPKSIRPWQHVIEPLSGYLLLARRLYMDPEGYADAWNFGPNTDSTKTVKWVVDAIRRITAADVDIVQAIQPAYREANVLVLDSAKARQRLGWVPTWSIEKTIANTAQWYEAFARGENIHDFSLHQLDDFERDFVSATGEEKTE